MNKSSACRWSFSRTIGSRKKTTSRILLLTTDTVKLHPIDFEDPEISDYNMIPNSVLLSDRLRVCLQESDEVPTDFTRLFNTRLFSISTSLVPPAIKGSQSCQFSAELR